MAITTPTHPGLETSNTALVPVLSRSVDADAPLTPEELLAYEQACRRLAAMPNDIGWIFVAVGVLGVILPGIIGFPFVIVGGAVLFPGGRKWLSKQTARKPGNTTRAFVRQMKRFLDDFERDCMPLPPE